MITARNIVGSNDIGRVADDFYATHPKSVHALLQAEPFMGSILEPCCGQGHISEVLKEYYPNQVTSFDLVDRGYGISPINFLEIKEDVLYCNIITNPPYSLAQEFVEKSLKVTTNKVAMFLKIQFLESLSRYNFFQQTPLKTVYVFSNRQATLNNGQENNPKTGKVWATTMCHAWFVWEHGYNGSPIIKWLKTK